MLVILLSPVSKLGSIGDIVQVKPGFARNFLIPRSIAVLATRRNIENLEKMKEAAKASDEAKLKKAIKLQEQVLSFAPIAIYMNAGESDKLFGSVSSKNIVKYLKEKDVSLTNAMVSFEAPIKSLGVHTANIQIHPSLIFPIEIHVLKSQ